MSALAIQTSYGEVDLLGPAEKAEVIDALYKHFTMAKVVEKTGYALRRILTSADEDNEFQSALALADKHLSSIGEDELKRRAIFGVESVVVANGRVVYEVKDGQRRPMVETKYSDSLLKTYLEANRRDKFGAKLEIIATHKGVIALPAFSPEMMQLLLADARGESVQLIQDSDMDADAAPEVIDAEYTDITDAPRADQETIQERVRAMTTGKAGAEHSADRSPDGPDQQGSASATDDESFDIL